MNGHITATMLIVNEERTKVLLIGHKTHKLLMSPGGHIDEGETTQEAALREAAEETGLKNIKLLSHDPFDIDSHPIVARPEKEEGPHYHFDYLFIAEASEKEPLVMPDEVFALKWLAIDGLLDQAPHMKRIYSKLEKFIAS